MKIYILMILFVIYIFISLIKKHTHTHIICLGIKNKNKLTSNVFKKPKRSSLFLGSLNKPFDTRFLDHNGLILIAEMKIPNYDTILLQSKSKKQKTKSHSIRNSLNQLQQNYNTRVLANVRSQHNEFSVSKTFF